MIYEMNHSVEIQSPFNSIFETCQNVEKWSAFMPAVKDAKFISISSHGDIVEITAEANDQIWTWQSKRIIDPDKGVIKFDRLSPPKNILRISGFWKIQSLSDRICNLSLRHEFELIDDDPELVDFFKKSIRSNATRDLQAIKNVLET